MKTLYKQILLLLSVLVILLKCIIQNNPNLVETYYSNSLNKSFIQRLSTITALFPFSLFELLVFLLLLGTILYLVIVVGNMIARPTQRVSILGHAVANLVLCAIILYVVFLLGWGFNYHRLPFQETANFNHQTYSNNDLIDLYDYLIEKANKTRLLVAEDEMGVFKYDGSYQAIFKEAPKGYLEASKTFNTLAGTYGHPKPIMLSKLMNYTMITGIYSPFTAEANVNIAVPDVTLLFTTMHEMAHQRGYASEDEANLIAFITCISHPNNSFQYAGYSSALTYVNNALAKEDLEQLKALNQKLSPKVRQDIKARSEFWSTYEGPVEVASTHINNTYLKLNGVEDGVKSYGRMVDGLLAYYLAYLK